METSPPGRTSGTPAARSTDELSIPGGRGSMATQRRGINLFHKGTASAEGAREAELWAGRGEVEGALFLCRVEDRESSRIHGMEAC